MERLGPRKDIVICIARFAFIHQGYLAWSVHKIIYMRTKHAHVCLPFLSLVLYIRYCPKVLQSKNETVSLISHNP